MIIHLILAALIGVPVYAVVCAVKPLHRCPACKGERVIRGRRLAPVRSARPPGRR